MTKQKRNSQFKILLQNYDNPSFFASSKVSKVTDKIAKQLKEANVTLEDLLETLDEERKILYQERYGDPQS